MEGDRLTKQEQQNLAAAMEFCQREPSDTIKAIHAIIFLLAWSSGGGNEAVPGMVALGLGCLAEQCMKTISQLYTLDDILRAGGVRRFSRRERQRKSERRSSVPGQC